IPLLLPWVLLFVPVSPLLLRRPIGTLIAGLAAAAVSFLPTAILNVRYCGDWSGAVLEPAAMTVKNPAIGLAGNGFQLALNNFVPTFFPLASWWNRTGYLKLPHPLWDPLVANFDTGIQLVGEIPNEDWAGLGFGLSVLAVLAVVVGLRAP